MRTLGALVCLTLAAGARVSSAQFVSVRGDVAAVGEWRPSVQLGVEGRSEIGDGTSTVDSLGVTHRQPPAFLWSIMGLGGVTLGRDGHATSAVRATAQGQIGLLRRESGSTRIGFYAVGLAEPRALGALVRYEPMPAAAIQAGWVHRAVRPADVAMVQLDVGLSFLTDLLFGGSAGTHAAFAAAHQTP